jgi:hypothetical protein
MVGGVDQTASFSQNYLTFELAIQFGGGRKAKPAPIYVAPPPAAPAPVPAPAPAPAPEPPTT